MKKDKLIVEPVNAKFMKNKIAILAITLTIFYTPTAYAQTLIASWYSRASLIKEGTRKAGEEMRMANGKIFTDSGLTCATRLYPLGTLLRISTKKVCKRNGRVFNDSKSVVVQVTDRISRRFARTRIDLSRNAFTRIADLEQGIVQVRVERIK